MQAVGAGGEEFEEIALWPARCKGSADMNRSGKLWGLEWLPGVTAGGTPPPRFCISVDSKRS